MSYSHSQIQLYKTCPRRYRYEKVDKLPIPKDDMKANLYFPLGNAVHHALEMLYKGIQQDLLPSLERILRHYQYRRDKELIELLQKTGKSDIFVLFPKEELETTKARGMVYIKRYYESYYPFTQQSCHGTEVTLWFEIQGTKFQAKLDRVDMVGDAAYIIDYKTSRSLPKDGQDDITEQMQLYALAIQTNYGERVKTIIGSLIYLHLEKEQSRAITQEMIMDIKQKYHKVIGQIEQDRFIYNFGDREAFKPIEGRHCGQCPFQRICPVGRDLGMK